MGEAKVLFIVKFKDELNEEQIEDFIKNYTKLVDVIEPYKSLKYGTDLGSTNYQQGFTHVFELTFESKEGVAEFLAHPAHVAFTQEQGFPKLDKFIVIDYYPIHYP